jgi:hypothetical protein
MTLPRQFRRPRIGLIGFGDVARRLLMDRLATPGALHGPIWVAVSRSGLGQLSPTEQQRLRGARVKGLRWNLDHPLTARRLATTLTHQIILSPPAESGLTDRRMRHLGIALRAANRSVSGVYLSTTGVYGNHQGRSVSEVSRCQPTQPRSVRRLDAENALRRLSGVHVLRVPGIYAHDRLPLARLTAGQPALREQDDVFTNHIHANDLARIAWLALWRGRPGRVTNAVDQTQLKMADYFDAVADAVRLPRPPRLSKSEMQALGETGAVNPMMMSFLSESRRVTTQRLQKELRVTLRYPTVHDTLRTLEKTVPR